MAGPDVRIRVRESVIRVHVSETAIRAVIRITAPQDQLIPLYLPPSPVGSRPEAASVVGRALRRDLSLAVILPRIGRRVFILFKEQIV